MGIRNKRAVGTGLLLALVTLGGSVLTGCGGSCGKPACTLPAIANKLFGKTWTGQMSGDANRLMQVTFQQSGCDVVGKAILSFYGSGTLSSFPVFANGLDGSNATFPVTISGDQATFSPTFWGVSSTNNNTTSPRLGILVVPGFILNGTTCRVTIADASLNGTYSLVDPDFGVNESGSLGLSPDATQPANVTGHWTGTMTADQQGAGFGGTLDLPMVQTGNEVALQTTSDPLLDVGNLITTEVTVSLANGTGVHGVVIDNQILLHITFLTPDHFPGGTNPSQPQHRFLKGTINGGTITGVYYDQIVPQGTQATGKFALTLQ